LFRSGEKEDQVSLDRSFRRDGNSVSSGKPGGDRPRSRMMVMFVIWDDDGGGKEKMRSSGGRSFQDTVQ